MMLYCTQHTLQIMIVKNKAKIKKEMSIMKIVKTWCEKTSEGKNYLKYNRYGRFIIRIFGTNIWICLGKSNPSKLNDVNIII